MVLELVLESESVVRVGIRVGVRVGIRVGIRVGTVRTSRSFRRVDLL